MAPKRQKAKSVAHHTPPDESALYARGLLAVKKLHGQFGLDVLESLNSVNPDLKNWVIAFGYGTVYSSPGLGTKDRQIATLTALICLRHLGREFESHVRAALKMGLSRTQIAALAAHTALYAGFPAALSATAALRDIFARLDGDQ